MTSHDPVAAVQAEGFLGVGVDQGHPDLAPVARVDGAGGVDQGDAVLGGQAGARVHEGCVAVGQRDGEPGADDGPLAGQQFEIFGRVEVGSGVARVGVERHRQPVVEPLDENL